MAPRRACFITRCQNDNAEWAQGLLGYVATFAPELGRALCVLGRFDEAEQLAQRGHEVALPQDATAQSMWRQAQALVLAHRGEHAEAERLAREAVAIMEQTDSLNLQGDTLRDLAEVLHAAGRAEEAAATLVDALDRYERKRNLPMARQVREQLSDLQASAPPV
jgi:tetratricopeptide (TPR) repeat protein